MRSWGVLVAGKYSDCDDQILFLSHHQLRVTAMIGNQQINPYILTSSIRADGFSFMRINKILQSTYLDLSSWTFMYK